MDQIDSRSASDTEDQKWTSDSPDDAGSAHPTSDCGIGHRVLASRSVLALAIDELCVFAGLQGGDIFVSDPVVFLTLWDAHWVRFLFAKHG